MNEHVGRLQLKTMRTNMLHGLRHLRVGKDGG
jgi:hypothetical protein